MLHLNLDLVLFRSPECLSSLCLFGEVPYTHRLMRASQTEVDDPEQLDRHPAFASFALFVSSLRHVAPCSNVNQEVSLKITGLDYQWRSFVTVTVDGYF